jgi:hypothetical protein
MRAVVVAVALVGCTRTTAPPGGSTLPTTTTTTDDPQEVPPGDPPTKPPPGTTAPDVALYALDDALDDALSGTWQHVGTGNWYGIDERISACAYRNDRVLVVNVYCSTKELNGFRVDILSPTKGRVSLYAEADTPISTLARGKYVTFLGESQQADPALPAIASVSFAALRAYEEKRVGRGIPLCSGGIELGAPLSGCTGKLDSHEAAWAKRNNPFLANPNAAWYRIVKELRARARKDGKKVERSGG